MNLKRLHSTSFDWQKWRCGGGFLSESDYLIDKRAYLKEKHKEEENCITLKLKGLKKEQQENKNDN